MAQVTVMIDGKVYRMACEEGQEEHLSDLAARFNRYVTHLKDQFGEIGDLRLTVMAGIMITDELADVIRKVETMGAEIEALKVHRDDLKVHRDDMVTSRAQTDEMLAGAITDLAARLNGITQKLSSAPGRQPIEVRRLESGLCLLCAQPRRNC